MGNIGLEGAWLVGGEVAGGMELVFTAFKRGERAHQGGIPEESNWASQGNLFCLIKGTNRIVSYTASK